MVHIRTILTLSIAILAADNVLVEAGEGAKARKANLSKRVEAHKETLRSQQDGLHKNFGSMTQQVEDQLTQINYIIIDQIMGHKSFLKYLKNVFLILRKYAVRQINTRYEKLKDVYKNWEKRNFPDKKKKDKALKILKERGEKNKAVRKKNAKNEKK